MTADQYLYRILAREAVDTSVSSPLRQVAVILGSGPIKGIPRSLVM